MKNKVIDLEKYRQSKAIATKFWKQFTTYCTGCGKEYDKPFRDGSCCNGCNRALPSMNDLTEMAELLARKC